MRKTTLACALVMVVLSIDDLSASVTPPPPLPIDTTIRILLIADNRLTTIRINEAKSYLIDSWVGTDFQTATPTSIQIVNNESVIFADESVFTGDPDDQIDEIRDLVEALVIPTLTTLRDLHGADIVIGLSSDIDDYCGGAEQDNWLKAGSFPWNGPDFEEDEDNNDFDLREANDDYIAVAQLSGQLQCQPYLAAHEFGHLLGGAHAGTQHGFDGGLLPNSQPFWSVNDPPRGPPTTSITVMGSGPDTADCPHQGPQRCNHLERFSDYTFGNSTHRHADTINMTARSVANYRAGSGFPVPPATCSDGIDNDDDNFVDSADPECAVCNEEICPVPPIPPPTCDATTPPTNMLGWVVEVCVPGTFYTKYQVVWTHDCPNQVSEYEVWAAQPTTDPYTFRWAVTPPHTRPIVGGPSARIKVKSCGVGGCSGLSSSSFLAVDIC